MSSFYRNTLQGKYITRALIILARKEEFLRTLKGHVDEWIRIKLPRTVPVTVSKFLVINTNKAKGLLRE